MSSDSYLFDQKTIKSLVVSNKYDNARADVFLAENLEDITRSAAVRLISEGHVHLISKDTTTCGGILIKKNSRVRTGDIIMCNIPPALPYEAVAEHIPLDIVYEDNDIIVINKPRGLVVHPAAGHYSGTLVNALLYHCGSSLSGIGGVLRPGIVHRLDKDTSGLMVVAKNDTAHTSLANQLASRQMQRYYQALCIGRIKQDTRRIDVPIGRHPKDRKKMASIVDQRQKSRNAVTHITVLERFSRFTLVEAQLETGRTHQIRVHLSYIGHPVLGDPLYGPNKQPFNTQGQVLHSKKLSLCHPTTQETMNFEVSLPEYFCNLLDRFTRF